MNQEKRQKKIISSMGWSSLSSIVSYLLLFTRTFILVRFLAPEDFGVMALSLLLVAILKQLSSIGLEQAIIQEDNLTRTTINTVWSVSILRGFVFFALINIFSPYYSSFFNEPELVKILAILSIATIFNGYKNSYVTVLQKELKFDLLFKINVSSQFIEFIATIVLAVIYQDVIALAFGFLIGSVTGLILSFLLLDRKPNFVFDKDEFFKLFKFGKWVFSGGILIFLILNIDTTLVGKLLGATLLGYYSIAFRFANFAATDIVLTFSKSIYPSFSLVKSDLAILRDYFFTTIQIIAIGILPIMIILGLYAESFVISFLGMDWVQVILPLKILVIFGTIRSFASVYGYVFWSLGKPEIQTKISLIQLIILLIIIYPLTYSYGIEGTALAVTIPMLISFFISVYYLARELRLQIQHYMEYLYSSLLSSACLVLLIVFMQGIFESTLSVPIFMINFIFLFIINVIIVLLLDYLGNKKVLILIKNIANHFKTREKTRNI